jgi:hypothetical protein
MTDKYALLAERNPELQAERTPRFSLQRYILLPLEIEPPIVQGRMTCEVANGRG